MPTEKLKPWREIAIPRKEVADGSFDESVFAADLGLVDRGRGPKDYVDPVAFCEKTYPTHGLRAVLDEIAARLRGDASAAGVYRLQTEFGGGKTHTLLAAYHLFRDPAAVAETPFAAELVASTGKELPQATVVVLDGSSMAPGAGERVDGSPELHTLLGQLAYRVGGEDAYAKVADQDASLLGSSTTQLAELLEAHTPCLILLDETLEYLNKALSVLVGDGNLAGTTLTFIKELCTAASNVAGAAVVATLTSSRLEDYASVAGEEMQERLSMVVGRTENIVTPVDGDDIFPILHRRLFTTLGDEDERRAVANAYAEVYEAFSDAVPASFREAGYRERLISAYPFHPELVDILTNRWGSLSGFQRTRGALRTLAHTVKSLSQRQHQGELILPGDVDLADAGIRAEILRFAGESYKAALNSDIIRADSKGPLEDERRGGQAKEWRLATGLATTAFLNSFGAERVVGASTAQMLLGVARPGISRGLIDDVRDALAANAWYMRLEGGRYRFTTEPTLNKVVMEREGAVSTERVTAVVREAIGKVAPSTRVLRVVPRVDDSSDLPDDPQLTLGILNLDQRIGRDTSAEVLRHAEQILHNRGAMARTNKNVSMLIVADDAALRKARASARTLAALRDVKDDPPRLSRFNKEQRDQLDERLKAAEERVPQQVAMAFRHLLLFTERDGKLKLEAVDLGPAKADARIGERVLEHLRAADRLVDTTLAPAALLADRFHLFRDGDSAIELDELAAAFARYPRLPKLATIEVLRSALISGTQQGLFGLVSGSSWDAADAVVRFREAVTPDELQFQPGTYLIRAAAAQALVKDESDENRPGATTEDTHPSTATPGTESVPETDGKKVAPRRMTLSLVDVPSTKMRDVVRGAILPLAKANSEVEVDLVIRVDGGTEGVGPDDLDLTIIESLRQLGLSPDISKE
jgi:Protein of unknown function (DUF499)